MIISSSDRMSLLASSSVDRCRSSRPDRSDVSGCVSEISDESNRSRPSRSCLRILASCRSNGNPPHTILSGCGGRSASLEATASFAANLHSPLGVLARNERKARVRMRVRGGRDQVETHLGDGSASSSSSPSSIDVARRSIEARGEWLSAKIAISLLLLRGCKGFCLSSQPLLRRWIEATR